MESGTKIFLLAAILFSSVFASSSTRRAPLLSVNGLFKTNETTTPSLISGLRTKTSENGTYTVEYGFTSDGFIGSLAFFENGSPGYFLSNLEARAVDVSNAGILLLVHIDPYSETPSQFDFYTVDGRIVLSKAVERPEVSRFTVAGNLFGVITKNNLVVINPMTGVSQMYRPGKKFDVSDDGAAVAVAYEGGVSLYFQGRLVAEPATGFIYNRDIKISPDKSRVAVADVNNLRIYEFGQGGLVFQEHLAAGHSYRELRLGNHTLWAGIKFEDSQVRRGILKTYEWNGGPVTSFEDLQMEEPLRSSGFNQTNWRGGLLKQTAPPPYPPIPWPFAPQDQPHQVWNNYEGLNSDVDGSISADYPYVHQGVDIEVDAGTPVYSVDTGIVKYRGDLGGSGDMYWRIAVSPQQVAGYSNGWLYAHMVQSSINYDVGDRIPSVGLHLGDIVAWYGNVSGHIHFCEIRDQGNVWSYTDDEWGLTHNPELSLTPYPDTTAPLIVTALTGKSKFAYSPNNSGYNADAGDYFFPDSARGGVNGDIDITVELYDYIVYQNFTQPAFALNYWVRGIDPSNSNYNRLIIDTSLAQIRNHAFDFYSAGRYKPVSQTLYQVDDVFMVGGWFNRTRTFAHVLTNNNGDSLLTIGEADSALHTADYWDGWYRVFAQAFDAAGNVVLDSEDVYFNNGNIDPQVSLIPVEKEVSFEVEKGISTIVRYTVARESRIDLVLFSSSGEKKAVLVSGRHAPGSYTAKWDGLGTDGIRVEPGLYFLRLDDGRQITTRKLVYSPL